MSITATLTGKLKAIFTASSENKVLPILEARKENEELADGNLRREKTKLKQSDFHNINENIYETTNPKTQVIQAQRVHSFDPFDSFDSLESPILEDNSFKIEHLENFTLQDNSLRSQIVGSVSVSEEKISAGHTLLAKAFSVSDEVLGLVSAITAKNYKVLPVDLTNSTLSILYADEVLRQMCEEFIVNCLTTQQLNYDLKFVLTPEATLLDAIDYAYSTISSTLLVNEEQELAHRHNQLIEQLDSEVTNEKASSIIFDAKVSKDQESFLQEFFGATFREVHARRGTDCDFDFNIVPKRDGSQHTELVVHARIDNSNVVIKRQKMTLETFLKLVNVGKYIAGLDTAKNRGQMTGYISAQLIYGTRTANIEMRCNVIIPKGRKRIPTISIRFQSQQENNFTFNTIGLSPSQQKLLTVEGLHATDGLIIICGKINCGKNTTLIALINELQRLHSDKKIILLEDPIEQILPDIVQIEVDNSDPEFGYSHFLKAALRHNPDIIGIGETRDAESAKLLIEAASVGHLTATTFHTSDTAKCIERLRGLTGDNAKLADSIRLIISQKLVRKNCTKCVKEIDTNLPDVPRLDDYLAKTNHQGKVNFLRSTGKMANGTTCRHCNGTGLKGRTGIFEILVPSEKIRNLILKGAPSYKVRKQAMKEGFKTLFINGLTKVLAGEITLAELIKQTGYPKPEKEGLNFDSDATLSDGININ